MAAGEIVLRAGWHWVQSAWNALLKDALPTMTEPFGYLRSPRQIIDAWPMGTIPLGPDVALFVHFDRAGAIRPYVLRYLRCLGEAGLSVVVVSNAGRLQPAAMASLQEVCAGVLVRRAMSAMISAPGATR